MPIRLQYVFIFLALEVAHEQLFVHTVSATLIAPATVIAGMYVRLGLPSTLCVVLAMGGYPVLDICDF